VGVSFKEPHHKEVHRTSNAPLALIIKPIKAETVNAAKAVIFWGCAWMNFKAKLPFYEMRKVYAVF